MHLIDSEHYPVLPSVEFPKPETLSQAALTEFDRAFNEKVERESAFVSPSKPTPAMS